MEWKVLVLNDLIVQAWKFTKRFMRTYFKVAFYSPSMKSEISVSSSLDKVS